MAEIAEALGKAEDPYLAGKLAAAFIRGLQGTGVSTGLKHFAANNQEYKRQNGDSQVDERALREIYLAPFETAVKEAKPGTVMRSYNKINGVLPARGQIWRSSAIWPRSSTIRVRVPATSIPPG